MEEISEGTHSDISIGDTDRIVMPGSGENVTQGPESVVEESGHVTSAPMTGQVVHETGALQKEKSKPESVVFKTSYQNLSPDFSDRTKITTLFQAENHKKRSKNHRNIEAVLLFLCHLLSTNAKEGSECSVKSTVGHVIK